MTPPLLTAIRLAAFAIAASAVSCGEAVAADAVHMDGAALGVVWAVPFIGLLLSIAILPLAAPGLWHHHYGKIAAAWSLTFLVPFALMHGTQLAIFEFLHVMLLDYVPFIVLLFALYTISGGVYISGDIRGTPLMNTGLLATGTAIASITGTTGASVLLIRPLLRANKGRSSNVHVVVFFIFLRNKPMQALAWLHTYKAPNGNEGHSFCTTAGASVDFVDEDLRRLIINAAIHLTGGKVPEKANVDYVDPYYPTFYGFINDKEYYKTLNWKPADFALGKSPFRDDPPGSPKWPHRPTPEKK